MLLKNIKLRDYQENILDDLSCLPSIGLFMKTGSGKTITSIARTIRNKTPKLLVICPQKVVTQWIDEIKEHSDFEPIEYSMSWSSKKKNDKIVSELDVKNCVVVNYDIICKMEWLNKINNDWTIILDESHKIKNMGTQKHPVKVTKQVLELGEKTIYKIILTATPTEKAHGGYIDLYTQLRFLGYMDMSYKTYMNRYCIVKELQTPGMPFPVKTITGYRMDMIEQDIKPIIKLCCRFYSPKYGDYEPQMIKVPIEKCKNYNKTIENRSYGEISFDNVSAFRIGKKTLISGAITGTNEYGDRCIYKDNTNKADWLEEFLSNTDDKVAILYNYNVELDVIKELCDKIKKKYIVINGSIKDKHNELKKDFDVVIGQYEAFGESLDGLQYKCHLMIFYSMPDSSRAYKQSLGRIDRIGQTEVPTYYHLVMKGTIDEQIYKLVQDKVEFSEKELNELAI